MELNDLGTKTTNGTSCGRATNSVPCGDELLEKSSTWIASRNTIKHQIQQLRAQLNELKQIRKYLKLKRPVMMEKPPARKSIQFGASPPVMKREVGVCLCNDENNKKARKLQLREQRIEERRERKFERMLRMERKRKQVEKEEAKKMKNNDHCKSSPLWTEGPFCACTNSNNNTYWCVRNINETHNYLYCEYVTGMMTYFDLRVDPFQLRNLLYTLSSSDLTYMHAQVTRLRNYSGKRRYLKMKQKQKMNQRRTRYMRK